MTTNSSNTIAVKSAVQEHYGRAITNATGCCSEQSTEVLLYGAETLADLPEGVVTASFGCGNALALADLRSGEVVIDLGSGGGLEVILAAQRVGPSGFVYGLDMTDAMLETARRNAERVGATNVSFLKGDIEAIPLPDQSVDVIMSNCVINLVPDKAQVLHDAFRVLKPGGRLAVSDIVFDGDITSFSVSEQEIRSALSWSACFAGALTSNDYRLLLEDAGFEQIRLEVTRHYTLEELRSEGSDMLQGLPTEVMLELEGRITSCAISARRPN